MRGKISIRTSLVIIVMSLIMLLMPAYAYLSQSCTINEIMYNPEGNDNNMEFVELCLGSETSLAGWQIADADSLDILYPLVEKNSSYALIVEEGFDYSGLSCSVYSAGSTIGNNLNNDMDSIYIYDRTGALVDHFAYDNSIADNNGRSIEIYNSTAYESVFYGGSPCLENSIVRLLEPSLNQTLNSTDMTDYNLTQNLSITNTTTNYSINSSINTSINITINSTINYTTNSSINIIINTTVNQTINSTINSTINTTINTNINISINTTLNSSVNSSVNSSINSTVNYSINITMNTTFNSTVNSSVNSSINSTINSTGSADSSENSTAAGLSTGLCNISIHIEKDKVVYEEGEKVRYSIYPSDESIDYSIEYWIEDLFGRIVKKRYNTTNSNMRSWTPIISGQEQVFLIKARLSYLNCTDQDSSDDSAESVVVVKGDPAPTGSYLRITDSSCPAGDPVKFGELIYVTIEAYKGDTAKSSVSCYIEDSTGNRISSNTRFNIYDRYTEVELKIPLQIKPDCEQRYEDGEYTIVVEGIDDSDEQTISVSGRLSSTCKEIKIEVPTKDCTASSEDKTTKTAETGNESKTSTDQNRSYISSFYTLTTKYKESAKLFAFVKNTDNSTRAVLKRNYSLKTIEIETQELNESSGRLSFSVNLSRSKNLFMLLLISGNDTLDAKNLTVDFSSNSSAGDPASAEEQAQANVKSDPKYSNEEYSKEQYEKLSAGQISAEGMGMTALTGLAGDDSVYAGTGYAGTDRVIAGNSSADIDMEEKDKKGYGAALYESIGEKSRRYGWIGILVIACAVSILIIVKKL
ncbi:lamin tail domain-containing protein [Candidatus Woesearchaeota archaeon]|nr:lamin tail domain-containing protein [Candidatus Woesearchaeota archaeon]